MATKASGPPHPPHPPYPASPAVDAALSRWERHARPGLPDTGYALARPAGRTRYGIYRFCDGTAVFEPDGHILKMAPSPDGGRIAVQLADEADEDAVLVLVDTATGASHRHPAVRCRYDEVLWREDSSRLEVAAAGSRRLVELDPESGKRRESDLPSDIRVRLFPGGRRGLAAESRAGRPTRLIDRATGRELGAFPGIVRVVAPEDAADEVVVQDGGLQALDAESGAVRWRWADAGVRITSFAAYGDQVLVAGVCEGRSVLVRLDGGRPAEHRRVRWDGEPAVVTGVAYDAGEFHALLEGPALPPRPVPAGDLLGGTGSSSAPAPVQRTVAARTDVPVRADDDADVVVVPASPEGAEGQAFSSSSRPDPAGELGGGTGSSATSAQRTAAARAEHAAVAADDGPDVAVVPASPEEPEEAAFSPRSVRDGEFPDGGARSADPAPASGRRTAAARTEYVTVAADDGADITVVLTSPGDADGPAPLILTCYGGFGVPSLPVFEPTVPAWTEQGGRYAVAQIRGGGEHGRAWREAGRGRDKQRGIADLAAAARGLVDAGLTRPDLLVLAGASHGGVVVTACALAEPGLCAGVVSTAAPLDLLNLDAHPLGRRWVGEFGDPRTAEGRAQLEAVSPLHRAEGTAHGTDHPAFLGIVLDEDSRVAADDTVRMVAALRRTGVSAALWRAPGTGHGGNHLDRLHRLGAAVLGFAEHATGAGLHRPVPAANTGPPVPPGAPAPPGPPRPDEMKRT
ncbi:prolyl oligopeptidase family serine peptidase [Nocardiopsis halophila]|uniref:prolyl oligopeptidase family serine peptidase n=1 Tax=Nocardiopsis halophila TaxID=141692 RepID=UPI000348922D|nr:prolyl oligopeptidase family serine peptidase [Nocardiopsis halophila]